MYADIAFQQKIGEQDTLTYKVPTFLESQIKVGQLISIPLRRHQVTGLVWHLHDKTPDFKTSDISGILHETPLITETQTELASWISSHYFTPLFKVLKLFIPVKVFKDKTIRASKASKKPEKIPAEKALSNLSIAQKLAYDSVLSGTIQLEQKISTDSTPTTDSKTTTKNAPSNKFLIHGITGSGKTEIYLHLAKHFLDQQKQVLILVPEISLTPQTVEYFESRLQIKAAVIHSKLSEGEKFREWNAIRENRKPLVIGSRSSIFSPFTNLALIIIDEEHEFSYKQDQSPRYMTHKVAEKILELSAKPTTADNSQQNNTSQIKLVLGSATPSIETAFKYATSTLNLHERIGESQLPKVHIVDMRDEFRKKNKSIFSDLLHEKITETLNNKKQVILFLNRRGTASSIVCRDCGFKLQCEDCDVPMTYHARTMNTPSVICHHCGKIGKIPINCPSCKGFNIRYLGIGTERIEEETKKMFTNAKVLRADKDTTSRKNSFEQIYSSFKKGEADILIGTQMIGKGLHLPNVNLVGVILADIGLNIPDFRSSERTFQLLTQVAGRAGRTHEKGEVVIQTYNPDNIAIHAAETHDYTSFYNIESEQRRLLSYPPFIELAQITIVNKNFQKAKQEAEILEQLLKKAKSENPELQKEIAEIISYPAFVMRLHNQYRYRILIKGKNPSRLIELLDNKTLKDAKIDIANTRIDIDPIYTS